MIPYYYQMALMGKGQAYLDAEKALIEQGQNAIPYLQEQAEKAGPFERLMIHVILQLIAGNGTYRAVLDFFDQVESETAPTVRGAPHPLWVAGKLIQDYGDRAAPLLGVYLNKLASIWPGWKIIGTILYLGKVSNDASAEALIKFAIHTPSEHYRKIALQSLIDIGDEDVLIRLESEIKIKSAALELLKQAADQIREKLKGQA